jgi:RNA polymerase sigma-70 factor (ECF subfamily)
MIAEDRDYIDRVLAGEKGAFDGLVRKYNRMAGAIAYGIVGDFVAAEDIVQEAFFKAYQSLDTLREMDKFKLWLAGIVRSRAIDWLRHRKGTWALPFSQAFPNGVDEASGPGPRPVGSSPPVEERAEQEELREKVLEAIRSLPEEYRLVVSLKHMEGLSYREIAELTGSTVSAVESRLFRARHLLKKRIAGAGAGALPPRPPRGGGGVRPSQGQPRGGGGVLPIGGGTGVSPPRGGGGVLPTDAQQRGDDHPPGGGGPQEGDRFIPPPSPTGRQEED